MLEGTLNIRQLLRTGHYWLFLLALAAISLIDYVEEVRLFSSWVNTLGFQVIHEMHDALGIAPIVLAARRFRGRSGYLAAGWFALIHVPYYYIQWPQPTHAARLGVVCAIGAFVSYLVELQIRDAREKERANHQLADIERRFSRLDDVYAMEKLHALGRVAAGVAHDFNNILAAILFQAEVALRKTTDPAIRAPLENVQQAALDGAETVRRIREFSQVKPSQEGFSPVDIREVVEGAIAMSRPQWKDNAQARGITININASLGEVPPIRGNVAQLRQVLFNLIVNAVEALPQGGNINIEAAQKDEKVVITVRDNGVGMDEETKRQAFEPFFTTKGPSSTGLGLSVVYGIVARHGGRITVESTKGSGSAFSLAFPVATKDKGEPAAPPVARESRKLNMLVIDDEPLVAEGLGELLKLEGHQATVCTSAAQGVDQFRQAKYDAVISDLGMPEMNGWELCAAIKKMAPDTPVAILTGWGDNLDEKARQASGADFVLAKPLPAGELAKLLREIASHGR